MQVSPSQQLPTEQQTLPQQNELPKQHRNPSSQQVPLHMPQLCVRPQALVSDGPQARPWQSGSAQQLAAEASQPQAQGSSVTKAVPSGLHWSRLSP
jgi:hypothetical protein